jgi:cytochrome c biogenesis protein CcdA
MNKIQLLGAVLGGVGFALIANQGGWEVAVGVLLCIWGNIVVERFNKDA